jgi:hypothetical protein
MSDNKPLVFSGVAAIAVGAVAVLLICTLIPLSLGYLDFYEVTTFLTLILNDKNMF